MSEQHRRVLKRAEGTRLTYRGHDGDERCEALMAAGMVELPRRRDAEDVQRFLCRVESWAAWIGREAPPWDDADALKAFLGGIDGLLELVDGCRRASWQRLVELDEENE